MENTTAQLDARVTGRVHGVGFRMFVRDAAARLNLTGWVRNEADGSVRVQAFGPRPALETLLAALQRGPHMARVEAVEPIWGTPGSAVPDWFEVRG
jgi:acylphosphatase